MDELIPRHWYVPGLSGRRVTTPVSSSHPSSLSPFDSMTEYGIGKAVCIMVPTRVHLKLRSVILQEMKSDLHNLDSSTAHQGKGYLSSMLGR